LSAEREVFTLVALETAQIQSYIFKSNRLKENVGASYLVAAATEDWVYDIVRGMELAHNVLDTDELADTDGQTLDVEVLYCGGGNAVLLFADEARAREFVRTLSQKVLVDAPGLRLTFHVQTIKWSQPLSYQVSEALNDLRQQRSFQPPRLGVHGLGVTVMGASTSLPAVTLDRDPDGNWEPISAETEAKRRAVASANAKLRKVEDDLMRDWLHEYEFPLELDDLGRSEGKSSFIAVVHADGNDMGLLIKGFKDNFASPQDNRRYIEAMRQFSEDVKRAARTAQAEMLKLLMQSIVQDEQGRLVIHGLHGQADIVLKSKDGRYYLPFRPLVSGGDDITFVCDGRLGIDLAAHFIKAFEWASEQYLNRRLTACAGVAIVNAHYPFARTYELAEELCNSAKQARHHTNQLDSSLMDWHITTGGLYGDLDEMRERDYRTEDGWLQLRPVFVDFNPDYPFQSWPQIQRVATEFQSKWRSHRSKAKGLMDALRLGNAQAYAYQARFVKDKGITLPAIDRVTSGYTWWPDVYDDDIDKKWQQLHGDNNPRCLYYDALELMDLYIPITQGEDARVP
jgi:hypothetical protein